MDFLQKTKQTLKNAGTNISQKASDVSGTVTMTAKIREGEKNIQNTFSELGKKLYEQHPELVEQYCPDLLKTIQDLKSQLEKDRVELAAYKGIVLCPSCGAENDKTAIMCSTCGTRIQEAAPAAEAAAPQTESAATVVCKKCGNPMPATNQFCPNCGAKVE